MRVTDFKERIASMLRDPNAQQFPNSAPSQVLRQPTDFGYYPPTLSGMIASLRVCGSAEASFARSLTKNNK